MDPESLDPGLPAQHDMDPEPLQAQGPALPAQQDIDPEQGLEDPEAQEPALLGGLVGYLESNAQMYLIPLETFSLLFWVPIILWKMLPDKRIRNDPRTKEPEWRPDNGDIPAEPLGDVFVRLTNICHVQKDTCDEKDGLEKVKRKFRVSPWPFKNCKHREWGYDKSFDLYRCFKNDMGCGCDKPFSEIHEYHDRAILCIARGELDEAVAYFSRVVQLEPKEETDTRLQAIAFCNLGIFLSSHLNEKRPNKFMKNDAKAVLLFKVGAVALKCPRCMYFYGHALAYGQGGVTQDLAQSIHYLSQAGQERVDEAFYELGKLHEALGTGTGGSQSLNVNMISVAEEFYDAALKAYTYTFEDKSQNQKTHQPPRGAWTPRIVTI
jgi:tetratricopeptide (TPR) repeat protein